MGTYVLYPNRCSCQTSSRFPVPGRKMKVRESLGHALLDVSIDAIVGMDGEGLVVEFNSAAERLFGYSCEEAIGQPLGVLIVPPHLREAHEQGFRRYLATGESTVLGRSVRLPALRADGSTVSVELSIARVEHEPPLFVGFIRDLTAAETAEKELKAAETRYRALVEQLPLVTYITSAADRPATLLHQPAGGGARRISAGVVVRPGQHVLRVDSPPGRPGARRGRLRTLPRRRRAVSLRVPARSRGRSHGLGDRADDAVPCRGRNPPLFTGVPAQRDRAEAPRRAAARAKSPRGDDRRSDRPG